MNTRRMQWLPIFFTLTACGSSAGTTAEANFVGQWTFQAGSEVTIACPGAPSMVAPIGNTGLALEQGADGTLHGVSSVGCRYAYTVDGNSATMTPGQTCEVPDGHGGLATERLTHDVLMLHDAHTLTLDAVGTIGPAGDGACALSVSGSLAR